MHWQKKTGGMSALDFSWFENVKKHKDVVPRQFGLEYFNLHCEAATQEDFAKVTYPMFKSKIKNIIAKIFPEKFSINYVCERQTYVFNKHLFSHNYFYYEGYFQHEKYFKHLREDILKSFSLSVPLDEKNQTVLNKILETNSVSIHIRRGDYVHLEHVSKTHGTCSLDYYKKAVEYITKKVENPHFFIFSDDIDWVIKNFKIEYPFMVVDFNQEKEYFDLNLMKNCKHNIIANSSFSWWGGWLNENPQKIVIAPKKWTLKKQKCDILPSGWVKL